MASTAKFLTVTSDNFDGLLKAAGLNSDVAEKIHQGRPTLEFTKTDNDVTITTMKGDKSSSRTYPYGKETEVTWGGIQFLMTVNKTDKGIAGTFKVGGKTGNLTIDKTDEGLAETMTLEGITSKRTFKKL